MIQAFVDIVYKHLSKKKKKKTKKYAFHSYL